MGGGAGGDSLAVYMCLGACMQGMLTEGKGSTFDLLRKLAISYVSKINLKDKEIKRTGASWLSACGCMHVCKEC
jgi:hypothetical protein